MHIAYDCDWRVKLLDISFIHKDLLRLLTQFLNCVFWQKLPLVYILDELIQIPRHRFPKVSKGG